MTCRRLGGPCDHGHSGSTADDVITAQDRHLEGAVAAGDSAHQEAADAMRARRRNPFKGMGWCKDMKKAFKALPEG